MSNPEEGFICPLCLVGFSSSNKLSGHFIEMHSESYPNHGPPEDTSEVPVPNRQGHMFRMVNHSRPKTCDSCEEIIWQDSIVCDTCGVTLHTDRCEDEYNQPCVAATDTNETEDAFVEEPRGSAPAPPSRGILPYVRRKVAKEKPVVPPKLEYPKTIDITGRDRYVNDEFDLDLTYITERIIAMSFPATGMEKAYRNNLHDVAKMLKTKHEENYMIFNLSERSYDITNFNNQVLDFGWPDHLAPSLERLCSVCKSMKSWLDSDPLHVAVVHCKGGKGRTGCVIAAFMHYSEICHSAEAALDRFAMKRFYDSKCGGVTQPSQRKYVHYFADLLAGKIDLQSPPVTLQHLIIHGIPNFDGKGGFRPFLKIYENMDLVHTSGLYLCQAEKERVKISVYGGLSLKGEVLIKCFHKKNHGMEIIFRCQFHSAVVRENLRMVYSKADLDDAYKDKRFDDSTRVELIFDNAEDQYPDDEPFADVRSSLLDGKHLTVNNGVATNGNIGLDDDVLVKRNSYASFRGGYDSGMPGDDPPNLIDLESPKLKFPQLRRERAESELSAQMDPDDIEHFAHPQSSELYTVVQKSVKEKTKREKITQPEEKPPPPKKMLKPNHLKAMSNDSLFSLLDRSDRRTHDTSPSTLNLGVVKSAKQPRPPPPSGDRKPVSQLVHRPLPRIPPSRSLDSQTPTDEDYAEIDVDTPTNLSPEGTDGPWHLKTKPTKLSPDHTPVVKPRPLRPTPHTKPVFKPKPTDDKIGSVQEELQKQILKQHLQRKRESAKLESRGEATKPKKMTKPSEMPSKAERKTEKPSSHHLGVLKHQPSYDEIPLNQEIAVEHLPNRQSAVDNDMWAKVKFPNVPVPFKLDSIGRRSSSSGNLTMTSNSGSDYYSNLADLDITPGAEDTSEERARARAESIQRSRSFSNHERVFIKATNANRDSIIPVSVAVDEPEYTNLEYASDGTLIDTTVEPPPPTHPQSTGEACAPCGDVEVLPPEELKARKQILANLLRTRQYENTELDKGEAAIPLDPASEEDYINQLPEGIFHIYSNQDELLDQLRTAHQPVDETIVPSSEGTPASEAPPQRSRLGSGASFLKFLRSLNLTKPKQQTIHSAKVSNEERVKTLAPFEISGISIGHVNRDYEAFLRTSAWGSVPEGGRTENQGAGGEAAHHRGNNGNVHDHQEPSARAPPPKPERPKNLAPPPGVVGADTKDTPSSPIQPRKYRRPAHQTSRENVVSPEAKPITQPPKRHPPLAKKPSAPHISSDQSRPHTKLHTANSDAMIVPSSKVKDLVKNQHRHSEVPVMPLARVTDHHGNHRSRPLPQKPVPYHDRERDRTHQQKPSESTVKSLMPYWYRPTWSREEAIDHVRPLEPGAFIVRDSQTVQGGYALTLKLSEDHVRRRKKLADDMAITEEMMVTHFLIQPDPEGVKLQGWNERAFKSLPEFIAHHTMEKLCMPCRLVLPRGSASSSAQPAPRRRPAGVQQALQTGAACNLVYLGSVDLAAPGDEQTVAYSVEQLRSMDSLSMNIVTFKASRDGVTLTDNINGMYIRRQYPISSISYCGLDPNNYRWNLPGIQHAGEVLSLKDKPCFGIVYHPQDAFGHSCLVFSEFDSSQPVTSVVNFVQKVMKEHKLAGRHAQK